MNFTVIFILSSKITEHTFSKIYSLFLQRLETIVQSLATQFLAITSLPITVIILAFAVLIFLGLFLIRILFLIRQYSRRVEFEKQFEIVIDDPNGKRLFFKAKNEFLHNFL